MKHRSQVSHFGRRPGPRRALIRGLVSSLIEHGKIQTTLAKAKELRRHVERAVTLGKKNTLQARRLLLERYPNTKTVEKIIKQWSPHFLERQGGYTRILKLGSRLGDSAEMAIIEFLDHARFGKDGQMAKGSVKKSKVRKTEKSEQVDAKSAGAKAPVETTATVKKAKSKSSKVQK